MDRTALETPIAAVSRRRLDADEEILTGDHGRQLNHNRADYDRLFAFLSGISIWTPPNYPRNAATDILGTYTSYWNANYASRRALYQQLRLIRSSLSWD